MKQIRALWSTDHEALRSDAFHDELMASVATFGAARDLTVVPTSRHTKEL